MPKISKVVKTSSKPGPPPPPKDENRLYVCSYCGKSFKRQNGNFSPSHSPIYRGNGGYLPVCNTCIDALYDHYKEKLGTGKAALRRICMKFDIYWNEDIYSMMSKQNTSVSRVKSYISRTNLIRYTSKTYDDTLDEEATQPVVLSAEDSDDDSQDARSTYVPTSEVVRIWGAGFPTETYYDLQERYEYWTHDLDPDTLDKATSALYRKACLLEVTINQNVSANKPVDTSIKSLMDIFAKLGIDPAKKREQDASDAEFDDLPFGEGIRIFETRRPVPKPLPEFEDVDGVIRYITVWFLGHLCKMLGIKNTYCKLYEEEIAKYRVDRPDLEEEDDEGVFNDIFGDETSS